MSATNAILAKIRPRLRKSAARFMDRRLRTRLDASDLVQDVLARGDITECPGATEAEVVAFYTFALKRDAMDASRAHLTSQRRSLKTTSSLDQANSGGALQDRLVLEQTSPSGAAARRERTQQLRQVIAELSDAEREAVMLYLADRSEQEIAQTLGRTPSAAQSILKRAKAKVVKIFRRLLPERPAPRLG